MALEKLLTDYGKALDIELMWKILKIISEV